MFNDVSEETNTFGKVVSSFYKTDIIKFTTYFYDILLFKAIMEVEYIST